MSSGVSNGSVLKMDSANHSETQQNHAANHTDSSVNGMTPKMASLKSQDNPAQKELTGTSPPSHIALGVKVLPDPEELAMFGSTSKEVKAHRSPRDKSPHVNFVDNTPKFPTAEMLEQSLFSNGDLKLNGSSQRQDSTSGEHNGLLDDLAAKHETAYFEDIDLQDLTDSQKVRLLLYPPEVVLNVLCSSVLNLRSIRLALNVFCPMEL